ncbi:hypothetical protein PG999_001599 [Apiospora kogelbergensis]|uniref:Uncharacterized protein n=1 Tax=Apiospora kogelbergensis TaxID=1337665 RepID=A0AAW0R5U1_9PEZI
MIKSQQMHGLLHGLGWVREVHAAAQGLETMEDVQYHPEITLAFGPAPVFSPAPSVAAPSTIRRYLGYEILTKCKSGSSWKLYGALVTSMKNEDRRAWYTPTGHKSWYRGIIPEFINHGGDSPSRKRGARRHLHSGTLVLQHHRPCCHGTTVRS